MRKLNALTLLTIVLSKANGFSTPSLIVPASKIAFTCPSHGSTTSAFCIPSLSSGNTATKHYGKRKATSMFASVSPSAFHSHNDDEGIENRNNIMNNIIDADVVKSNNATVKNSKKYLKNIQSAHPILQKSWTKVKSTFKKSQHKALTLFTAAVIMLSVMFTPFSAALAAPSGGRMGGSFGGGSRGSYSRSSSRSYSRSYSSPSRPYSSYNRGFSRGFSSGYYARPPVVITTGTPYATVVRPGPTFGDIVVIGFVGYIIYLSTIGNGLLDGHTTTSALGKGVSVAQISVALNVPKKDSPSSILSYLNSLSRTARTDSRVGVSNLVSQVALELLRQRRSIFAADTKCTHYNNSEKAEREFSNLAIKERSKFERENINKYGGVDYAADNNKYPQLGGSFSPQATAAVVTIILSIDGDSTKLPVINSVSDLEKALTQIASDVKVDECLRSAEVLWTPEDPDDTLSETDVIVDYPELRTL